MTHATVTVKTPDTPPVQRLKAQSRRLAMRIAAGERGTAIEDDVARWRAAWAMATGQPVDERRP